MEPEKGIQINMSNKLKYWTFTMALGVPVCLLVGQIVPMFGLSYLGEVLAAVAIGIGLGYVVANFAAKRWP
jgi:hypothetical protein